MPLTQCCLATFSLFSTRPKAPAQLKTVFIAPYGRNQQDPYYTTVAGSRAAAEAIRALRAGQLGVRTLQDYLADIS